jgi:hypothetical protein
MLYMPSFVPVPCQSRARVYDPYLAYLVMTWAWEKYVIKSMAASRVRTVP